MTADTQPSAPGGNALLSVQGLSKSFFGVQVLHAVSFDLQPGAILGLMGENGSGKSTTMNILGGVLQRDAGRMTIDGQDFRPRSRSDASQAGIAFIQQELNVFPTLTVEENLFVGRYPRRVSFLPLIDKPRMRQRASEMLRSVRLDIAPSTPLASLSPGERQLVEIAKALSSQARIVIFDEPTTSLTTPECERLFALIEDLRRQGLGIIYISHVLADVMRLADHITVLRDGRVVEDRPRRDITLDGLVTAMVGRSIDSLFPERGGFSGPAASAMRVAGVTQPNVVRNIAFDLRAGEILGVGGLMGSGRTELARILFGLDPRAAGHVIVEGKALPASKPRQSIRAGLAFLSEDRRHEGLMVEADVAANMALVALPSYASTALGVVAQTPLTRDVEALTEQLHVRVRGVKPSSAVVRALSGGNQQKVALGKWLLSNPRVLILDEPTRGVDVGAKQEIYSLICALADKGLAILLISSEIEELIGLCDRIMVLRRGEIADVFPRSRFDREAILRAAMWKERAA